MNRMLNKAFCFLLLFPCWSYAAQDVKPAIHQEIDPMSLWVRTSYPVGTDTIGQAVQYLLEPSGYRFVTNYPAPRDALRIGSLAIPQEARIVRTMPVIDALQMLAGRNATVLIDHNHKMISITEEK